MASNGEIELVPCLIAPTHTKNPILDVFSGSLYSLDMVRLTIEYVDTVDLCNKLDLWPGLFYVETYTSNRIGSYRYMWVWDKANAIFDGKRDDDGINGYKIALGFGLITPQRNVSSKGFIEFNPNKVHDKALELVRYLLEIGCVLSLARYDLAIDYPIDRDGLRMIKDGRKYGCEISNGITEYLGQRNKAGRVKVYDKQAESRLEQPCTRVELTCNHDWDVEVIKKHLPVVFTYSNNEYNNLRGVTKAFMVAVTALCRDGDFIEPWLRMVDNKTKAKIKNVVKTDSLQLPYSEPCIERALQKVCRYPDGDF